MKCPSYIFLFWVTCRYFSLFAGVDVAVRNLMPLSFSIIYQCLDLFAKCPNNLSVLFLIILLGNILVLVWIFSQAHNILFQDICSLFNALLLLNVPLIFLLKFQIFLYSMVYFYFRDSNTCWTSVSLLCLSTFL